MTEEDKKPSSDVVGWRPSKEAKELLERVKGEDRKKLLDKLVADEAKRQHQISSGPCEQETVDMIETYRDHFVPYFEKQLKEDERRKGLSLESSELIQYDKNQINWAKWWISHWKSTCVCGAKRVHAPNEQGDFKVKPDWIEASKYYDPEMKQSKR
jgi:hypothetical protein